jgi:capsule polysaccharide export protein KpsE/RkpR
MDKSDLILAAIERMYAHIVEIKTDVSVLKTDVSVLKSDMVEVKGDIGRLKARIDDLEVGQRAMRQVIGGNHLKVIGRIDQLSDRLERHVKHTV